LPSILFGPVTNRSIDGRCRAYRFTQPTERSQAVNHRDVTGADGRRSSRISVCHTRPSRSAACACRHSAASACVLSSAALSCASKTPMHAVKRSPGLCGRRAHEPWRAPASSGTPLTGRGGVVGIDHPAGPDALPPEPAPSWALVSPWKNGLPQTYKMSHVPCGIHGTQGGTG
jgi:hypothetical protein